MKYWAHYTIKWSVLALADRNAIFDFISRTPYIAAYRILGDRVQILRVLHGAPQWPDEIGEEPE